MTASSSPTHVHSIPSTMAKSYEQTSRTNPEVLAELVDNAIDAHATSVCIRFSDHSICVLDNGTGMDEQGLRDMFTPGLSSKGAGNIGGFGDGFKSSFGLANKVTVFSLRNGIVCGEGYDKSNFLGGAKNTAYFTSKVTSLDKLSFAQGVFAQHHLKSGTLVLLEDLSKPKADYDALFREIPFELGVKFYQFLATKSISVQRDDGPLVAVNGLDAMDRKAPTTQPLLDVSLNPPHFKNGGSLRFTAFFVRNGSLTDPFGKNHFGKVHKTPKGQASSKFSDAQGVRVVYNGRQIGLLRAENFGIAHATKNYFRAELVFDGQASDSLLVTRDKKSPAIDEALKGLLLPHLKEALALGAAQVKQDQEKRKKANPSTPKNKAKSSAPTGFNVTSIDTKKIRVMYQQGLPTPVILTPKHLSIDVKHPLIRDALSDGRLSYASLSVFGALLYGGLSAIAPSEQKKFLDRFCDAMADLCTS